MYVDGAPSPTRREDLVAGREATIRVERPGYVTQERQIRIGTDTSMPIVLVPIPEEKPIDRKKVATPRGKSTKTKPKEAPATPPLTTPATTTEDEPPPMIPLGGPKPK